MFAAYLARSLPCRRTLSSVSILAAMMPFTALAQPEMPSVEQPAGVPYWDNWTDEQGVSHLTKCKLKNFTLSRLAAHADPQWVNHAQQGEARMVTSIQPAHWKGGWHAPESVQWIIPIQGVWFVQSMDGTRVELNPGDALLSEDVGAKSDAQGHTGHLSGNVGDAPVALMITQFASAHASHRPCATE